jgi:hypothetical protein
MRATIALLTVAAANGQQASVARVPTQGSFGAELQARGDSYLDLHYVRTKKRKVLLHGVLDEASQQALKTYGTTLKSDQLAAHSHNKFAIPIATDGADPCPPNVTRHFTVKPWFWDNAWRARGVRRDSCPSHDDVGGFFFDLDAMLRAGTSGTTSRRWGIGWPRLLLVMNGWRWTSSRTSPMIASSSLI